MRAVPPVHPWLLGHLGLSRLVGLVLIASFVIALFPGLNWRDPAVPGIPAHDDIYQSSAFLICTFALLGFACDEGRKRHWGKMFGLIAIGAAFFADFAFATFSRVALLLAPVLAALLGWRERRWDGLLAACLLLGAIEHWRLVCRAKFARADPSIV